MASSLNLPGVSLLGFELLGKLILEELQLIRKDMKDEMRKVGSELHELYGVHKKILGKIDDKVTNSIVYQEDYKNKCDTGTARQNPLSKNDVEKHNTLSDESLSATVLSGDTIEKNQESPNDLIVIDNDDDSVQSSVSNNRSDTCDASSMFEGKNILIKEEVSSLEDESDLGNCFGIAYDEPLDITSAVSNAPNFDSSVIKSTAQIAFVSNSSNDLINSKYSICNPLLKKTESKGGNFSVSKLENDTPRIFQNETDFDISSNFQLETFSSGNNTSEASSSSIIGLELEESLNFRCQFCRKPFRHFSSYQSHVRSHTGEKPFTCSLCNKNFTQKGNLTKHMLLHQNQKPFKCDICGKQFAQKGSMKSHLLRHTKNDFFKCNVCDKTFRQLTHLAAHEQVHKM